MNQLFQKGEQKLKQYEEDGTSIHPCHANQIRKGQGWLSVGWLSDPGPPKNIQIFGRLVNTPWQKMPRCQGGGNIGINNLTTVAARLHDAAETRAETALVQNINDFQTVSSNIVSCQEKSLRDLPAGENSCWERLPVWTDGRADQIRKGKLFLLSNHGAIQENRTESVSNDRDHLRNWEDGGPQKMPSPQVNF